MKFNTRIRRALWGMQREQDPYIKLKWGCWLLQLLEHREPARPPRGAFHLFIKGTARELQEWMDGPPERVERERSGLNSLRYLLDMYGRCQQNNFRDTRHGMRLLGPPMWQKGTKEALRSMDAMEQLLL